jgi:hypothetical protein
MLGIVPALSLTWNEPPELVAEAGRIYVFDRLPHHLAPLTLPTAEVARRVGGHFLVLVLLAVFSFFSRESSSLRRVTRFAWGAAMLAIVGFAIEITLWNQPLIAARLLRYYWFRSTDVAAALAVALHITAWVARGFAATRSSAAWRLVAALIVAGAFLSASAWPRCLALARGTTAVSPADQKLVDYRAWVEVCDWIEEHTPPDALFLTPRLNLTFKWRTGRPEVANRKDIPQDARGIIEWHRRVKDIYYTEYGGLLQPLDSIGTLGTDRVRALAIKYGADFVLMDRGQLLALPVVFRNEEYIVYRIDN